jgi:predicted RNase H-like nuclease (RuvC/YqgF family)
MDTGSIVSIVVSGIAAFVAYASQRNASKSQKAIADASANATVVTNKETNRTDMEKEAYERARAFDTETIARQDTEITQLRKELSDCKETCTEQEVQIRMLQLRVRHLEKKE